MNEKEPKEKLDVGVAVFDLLNILGKYCSYVVWFGLPILGFIVIPVMLAIEFGGGGWWIVGSLAISLFIFAFLFRILFGL